MEDRKVNNIVNNIGKATLISLIGLSIASASIPVALYGYYDYAIRMLFLAYLADIIDGWVARKMDEASQTGFMLDRAIDRVSQVIVPLIIYISWIPKQDVLYLIILIVYSSLLISTAFYRLIYRGVTSLMYFSGLPMFFHAGVLITSTITKNIINPYLLVISAFLSMFPVKYFRRIPRKRSNPSPGVLPRVVLVSLMALLPYNNEYVIILGKTIFYGLVIYMVVGPLIYIVSRRLFE